MVNLLLNPFARLAARRSSRAASTLALALAASACSSSDGALELGHHEQPILRGSLDREHPQVMTLASHAGALCTGTLIDVLGRSGSLLTAAHCVTADDATASPLSPEQFVVLAGEDFLNPTDVFSVDAVHVHTGYDGSFAVDDVAIVRIELGDANPPTPILPLFAQEDTLRVNDRLLFVGYGQTERAARNTERRRVTRDIALLEGGIIAYTQEDGTGTCFGDSGGPGLITLQGEERVAAVISGGIDSDDRCSGGLGVSMRVSRYTRFIESVLSEGTSN